MIARPIGVGWQTLLADLSLILFMVTAAALAEAPETPPPARVPAPPRAPAPVPLAPQAQPVAVWRDDPGAPPLGQWLAGARDPRLQLTITVHYAPAARDAAIARAASLARMAGARGAEARIVVEPGTGSGAVLGYDRIVREAGTDLAPNGP